MTGRTEEEGGREENLLRIAGDIGDQTPVSWDDEIARTPGLADQISGLRDVERLAAAHARIAEELLGVAGPELIGSLLSHYRIVDRIGSGGMGVVYRARDEHLGGFVGLKVLHEDRVADESARTLLLREARLARSVNHPNVVTIFDVGESEGRVFIAMEYIEGTTLSDAIRVHPLPLSTFLNYGVQVASALHAAHEAGVVHRDLKSGNIRVTAAGLVKVLDFGIAVRTSVGPMETTMTVDSVYGRAGVIAGTVPYMAPEVLRGELPDRRSDIWALGVTLQEALTGRRPFIGERMELEHAIQQEDPAPLPSTVSKPLRGVIARCLKKDPGQRYQHASEVRAALEAIDPNRGGSSRHRLIKAAGVALAALFIWWLIRPLPLPPRPPKYSLLVLPSGNGSGAQEQQFLADGLTDDLINTFARLSSMRVRGRTTSYAIAHEQEPLSRLARKHSLDLVLESSVVRIGDRVRVNVELMDARADSQVWAQSYERPIREVLTLDSDIALGVADCLKLHLTSAERARLEPVPPVDLPVYQAYVLARNLAADRKYGRALASYAEATRLDSTFAAAYAGLAECYTERLYYQEMSPEEALPRAMAAASRALEIDPTQASAHVALAYVYGAQWDFTHAKVELDRALEDGPSSAEVWYGRSLYFGVLGRPGEEVEAMERAVSLDSLSTRYATELGLAYLNARRVDAAAAQFLRVQRDGEGDETRRAHAYWARCLVLQGRALKAVAELQGSDGTQGTAYEREELAYALARAGRKADALRMIARLARGEKGGLVNPLAIAAAQLAVGERESAFATLLRARKSKDPRTLWIGVDERFDSLRNDPRYPELIAMQVPPGT